MFVSILYFPLQLVSLLLCSKHEQAAGTTAGLSAAEISNIVRTRPEVLAEKVIELERKLHFLTADMAAAVQEAVQQPIFLATNLMQVIAANCDRPKARCDRIKIGTPNQNVRGSLLHLRI